MISVIFTYGLYELQFCIAPAKGLQIEGLHFIFRNCTAGWNYITGTLYVYFFNTCTMQHTPEAFRLPVMDAMPTPPNYRSPNGSLCELKLERYFYSRSFSWYHRPGRWVPSSCQGLSKGVKKKVNSCKGFTREGIYFNMC